MGGQLAPLIGGQLHRNVVIRVETVDMQIHERLFVESAASHHTDPRQPRAARKLNRHRLVPRVHIGTVAPADLIAFGTLVRVTVAVLAPRGADDRRDGWPRRVVGGHRVHTSISAAASSSAAASWRAWSLLRPESVS